jgi:hypothetical protein
MLYPEQLRRRRLYDLRNERDMQCACIKRNDLLAPKRKCGARRRILLQFWTVPGDTLQRLHGTEQSWHPSAGGRKMAVLRSVIRLRYQAKSERDVR